MECAGDGQISDWIPQLLGREIDSQLSLPDGGQRAAQFEGDQLIAALIISKNRPVLADRAFLAQQLGAALEGQARGALLAGRAATGEGKGAIICSCEGVGRQTLINAIHEGAQTIGDLESCTRAGTNCGSCKPELKQLLAETVLLENAHSEEEIV